MACHDREKTLLRKNALGESDEPHGANDHEGLASQAEGRLTDSFFSRSRPFLLANRNHDIQSSLEDLTQQVKRLHASFEGKDGSLVVEKHEYASNMAHLEEYLHINQVLKHLRQQPRPNALTTWRPPMNDALEWVRNPVSRRRRKRIDHLGAAAERQVVGLT